ncbi:unannotated protein [freshwater metagenome]|uniref:Unannotated protein n=1 Tax=freshwater metagenome TaxID=449393 RepID=A0A6J6EBE4_9ZZZZ
MFFSSLRELVDHARYEPGHIKTEHHNHKRRPGVTEQEKAHNQRTESPPRWVKADDRLQESAPPAQKSAVQIRVWLGICVGGQFCSTQLNECTEVVSVDEHSLYDLHIVKSVDQDEDEHKEIPRIACSNPRGEIAHPRRGIEPPGGRARCDETKNEDEGRSDEGSESSSGNHLTPKE